MSTAIRTIALTGASGMVGSHMIRRAASLGIRCVTTSRSQPDSLPDGTSWHHWDLSTWLDTDELDRLFGDVDALVHLGAITPRKDRVVPHGQMFDANVRACLCLGMWAHQRNIPVVYLSSSASYPQVPRITEDTTFAPLHERLGGFYGFTKMLGEDVFSTLAIEGLQLCILRPSSIYGTGLSGDQMVSIFLERALAGDDISISASPDSRVNLIHAADVASAMIEVAQRGITGTFNIAAPAALTLEQVARAAVAVSMRGSRVMQVQPCSEAPFIRFDLDCSAAERAFGFSCRVSLEEGLILMRHNQFL